MLDDVVFTFVTEDAPQGGFKLTHADYLKRPKLRAQIGRQATPPRGRRTVFLGQHIISFSNRFLKEHVKVQRDFEEAERLYLSNPLKYFVPAHQTSIDFLNWGGPNSLKVLHAGVSSSKSVSGVVDWLLDIVPTEADWPLFTVFGVKRREHRVMEQGGVAVVSYEKKNLQNSLWPQVIMRWCPPEHIQDYVDGKKTVAWDRNPVVPIAGTPVYFYVSSQKESVFTSQALDIIHWDEQHGESRFWNATDRTQRRDGRHIMTMTPHKLADQPETGAGSFVDKIRQGSLSIPLKYCFFQMDKLGILDWVVTQEEKESAVKAYITDPTEAKDARRLAEGRSKVYGEWHESSGLVVDNFEPGVHLVAPFEIPSTWTFYRYHDHGRKEPNACLLVAVNEADTPFIVGEWYETGKEIADNAKGIIEVLAGNTTSANGGWVREEWTQRRIRYTKSDPRSLSKALDNSRLTIQQEYQRHGLYLTPGSGERPMKLVPLLTGMFEVDMERKHYATKEKGAPGIYIFSTMVNTIKELTQWRWKTKRFGGAGGVRTEDVPEQKDDHLMTCLLQLATDRPMWVPMAGKKSIDEDDEEVVGTQDDGHCSVTGY